MPRALRAVERRRRSFAVRSAADLVFCAASEAAVSAAVSFVEREMRALFFGSKARPRVQASRASGSLWSARRARVVR